MKIKPVNKILILLGSLFLICLLPGCTQQKIEFQEGNHPGDETYSETFDTYAYIDPQFELHIQAQIFDEETANDLYTLIQADAEALSSTFGPGDAPSIFIVRQTPTGEIMAGDGAVYGTPDDITKGTYRHEFVKAWLGLTEPWKIAGAEGVVFGDEVDPEALRDYYSQPENLPTLSLFAAYFIEEFSALQSQATIHDTATAFTDFLLTEYGVDAFFGCASEDSYRQAWLDSLGVSAEYHPPFALGFLDNAIYSNSEEYPLIVTSGNRTYSFAEGFADSPDGIMYLLSSYQEGMEIAMDHITTNAPEHAAQIQSDWENLSSIYFEYPLLNSYFNRSGNSLHIGDQSVNEIFEITFNYLVPEADREMEIWKAAGIANYLFAISEQPEIRSYNYFLSTPDETWGDQGVYLELVQDYYLSYEDTPSTLDDFNFGRFYEGLAVISLSHPDLDLGRRHTAARSIADTMASSSQYRQYPGNSLTYPRSLTCSQNTSSKPTASTMY